MVNPLFKDEKGKRYGMLLVVDRAPNNLYSQAAWNCVCDCGEHAIIAGRNLRRGTESCGCLWKRRGNHTVEEARELRSLAYDMYLLGLSEAEIAASLKVTVRTVFNYLKGRKTYKSGCIAICTKGGGVYSTRDCFNKKDLSFALV